MHRVFGFFTVAALVLLAGCTVPDTEYCGQNEDCPRITGITDSSYVCHPTRHVCMLFDSRDCFSDDGCKDLAAPRCNLSTSRCEPCVLDSPSDTSCQHNKQTPYCGSAPGGGTTCVACRKPLDCPASAPICDDQHCRKCQKHGDCEGELNCDGDQRCTDSLVCITDADLGPDKAGQCAMNGPSGRVVYAYNAPASPGCSDVDGRPGTDFTMPFCQPEEAMKAAQAQGRLYVRIVAGGSNYQQTNPVNRDHFVFIGSPVKSKGIMNMAIVEARGTTFEVSDTGNVTIDEIELLELNPNTTIVKCTGTPPRNTPVLTLRNSIVRGSTQKIDGAGGAAAVDIADCQAKVYGNTIGLLNRTQTLDANALAHSRGLRITNNSTFTAASFLIENNVIAGNWDKAVDLYNVSLRSVTFHFNTIVYNGRGDNAVFGGITCPNTGSALVTLANSILFGNTTGGTGTQLEMPTRCGYKKLVVGTDSYVNAELSTQDPSLDGNFNLTAQSTACIDKAMQVATETLPSVDLRGNKRPQGTGHDIGAVELQSTM